MRPDLQGLEITKRELRRLSGVDVEAVNRFSLAALIRLDIGRDSPWLVKYLTFIAAVTIGFGHGIFINALKIAFPINVLVLVIELAFGIVLTKAIQLIWVKQRITASLPGLMTDVERFNGIIKSIDINDQLEEAGNPSVRLQDRGKVIEALRLTREDLVRALKTERILRENQRFISRNTEFFSNNLNALAALQVSDRASEQGRLLNEALQIAVSAKEEIRKLQDRRFTE